MAFISGTIGVLDGNTLWVADKAPAKISISMSAGRTSIAISFYRKIATKIDPKYKDYWLKNSLGSGRYDVSGLSTSYYDRSSKAKFSQTFDNVSTALKTLEAYSIQTIDGSIEIESPEIQGKKYTFYDRIKSRASIASVVQNGKKLLSALGTTIKSTLNDAVKKRQQREKERAELHTYLTSFRKYRYLNAQELVRKRSFIAKELEEANRLLKQNPNATAIKFVDPIRFRGSAWQESSMTTTSVKSYADTLKKDLQDIELSISKALKGVTEQETQSKSSDYALSIMEDIARNFGFIVVS